MFTQAQDSLISKDQDLEVLHDMSLQITVFLMYVLLTQHPVTTYGYAFLFSLTGYFGISFVLALIKLFGALVAVTGKISPLFCKYFWDGHSNLVNKGKWINGLTFLFFSLSFFFSPQWLRGGKPWLLCCHFCSFQNLSLSSKWTRISAFITYCGVFLNKTMLSK